MNEKAAQTEMRAPTVPLVGDLGSGEHVSAASEAQAGLWSTTTCLRLGALDHLAARTGGSA